MDWPLKSGASRAMALDLSAAKEVTPVSPDIEEPATLGNTMPAVVGAEDVVPAPAPVSDAPPLSEKEKAGVWLTWGVLVIIAFFIAAVLVAVWHYETVTTLARLISDMKLDPSQTLTDGSKLQPLADNLEAQRQSYRTFIVDFVQMILLNVLFPILTALLGYVFGTTRQDTSAQGDRGA